LKPSTLVPVTRDTSHHPRPPGHVLLPAAAIGGLAIVLSTGLALIGVLDRANRQIAALVSRDGAERFPKHLPEWAVWLATVTLAFGLTFAILETPGWWRRAILWLTTVILIAAWAPVLSLAAHAPDIAAPWIATVWSGACAIVYATNHRMACDDTTHPLP
jgi:hypothetical protein